MWRCPFQQTGPSGGFEETCAIWDRTANRCSVVSIATALTHIGSAVIIPTHAESSPWPAGNPHAKPEKTEKPFETDGETLQPGAWCVIGTREGPGDKFLYETVTVTDITSETVYFEALSSDNKYHLWNKDYGRTWEIKKKNI